MNLQPIHPTKPVFQFTCLACGKPCNSDLPGASADLDGAPFTAYCCPQCSFNRRCKARTAKQALRAAAVGVLLSLASLSAGAEPCKVNVNAATPSQLQLLSRTGPVLAGRIVEARPLDAPKLDAVKGIGETWLAVNGPYVTFSGPTTCTEKIRAPKIAAQGPKL